ncbi:cysteine peptidase family C39 domain-containing protein, partial [Pseudomonas syringae]
MNDSEMGTQMPDNAPRLDTGLASLVMLARFHQVAASPEQLAHEFGSPDQYLSQDSLLLAARKLGLKAKAARTTTERLDRTPLPAIAADNNGGFFIIARLDQGKALIHDPLSQRP